MKKLILILVMVMGISTGCQKMESTSSKPTFFVIDQISQDSWDKKANVAQYKLQVWTTSSQGNISYWKYEWFTLQEGLQVGDTLKLTK